MISVDFHPSDCKLVFEARLEAKADFQSLNDLRVTCVEYQASQRETREITQSVLEATWTRVPPRKKKKKK